MKSLVFFVVINLFIWALWVVLKKREKRRYKYPVAAQSVDVVEPVTGLPVEQGVKFPPPNRPPLDGIFFLRQVTEPASKPVSEEPSSGLSLEQELVEDPWGQVRSTVVERPRLRRR